ncbi:hypothetical protein RG963_15845 [Methanosarcina sp. Z-7115]|uniref:Uncharacterized protein n=1 Tax=Methanosarcina baikalica TaxID=3073890 RepID=A0ABU2D5G2_9EURY|nr:hypothetical protein [Methanosarcina sp. Z-7115]MDR7667218.1 hypothetical protein [Methanosarcina sp. Z-7115]
MGNSASNHLNENPENFGFFHLSNASYTSDYGIYNSTGHLFNGNKLFEQYTELATQLDTKRSAFYLESKENEIIFGCSLSVKADSEREERVVFIQVYKNLPLQYEIDSDIQSLKRFYERVKFKVENLDLKKYRLVGLWDEGDFRNINETPIEKDILEYTAGKIHAGKKVSVKISELSNGLSLILKLITKLRHRFTFTFDVSQYPSEADVSVSLIKPNPDFEIGENGTCREFTKPELLNLYKELGEEFFHDETSYSKESQTRSDSVSPVVKKILSKPLYYCSSSNSILDNFDDRDKVKIFQGLFQKINDPDIKKVLIDIYLKIESPECRKDLYNTLLSKNVYIEGLIEDLVINIYKEHNKDLFDLLFNNTSRKNLSLNNLDNEQAQNSIKGSKYNSFEKGVKKALQLLEYSDKINFIKYIANEAPSNPKAEGKILLKTLIEDLVNLKGNDFILKLNEEEAKNLDEIQGSGYLETKKGLKKRKRTRNIKTVCYASALVVIIFLSYFFICYTHSMGNGGETNSSGNNTENNSILCKYWKGLFDPKTENILGNALSPQDDQKTMKNNTTNETLKNIISEFLQMFSKK